MDATREQAFDCPHCGEPITVVLDLSEEGEQDYIEDCEVCCRPIRIHLRVAIGELASFWTEPAQ